MRTRRLPLIIPADLYEVLEQQAHEHDRDPTQQARYLLRLALTQSEQGATAPREPAVADGDLVAGHAT